MLTVEVEELARLGIKDYCPTRVTNKDRKPNITGQAFRSQESKKKMWKSPLNTNLNQKEIKRFY